MELTKKEPKTKKRHLDDGSDCANIGFQKCRKMGQEVSKNRFKIHEVGCNKHYYSDSKQTASKVICLDPAACSMKGFARKARVTTTITRKKPLEHNKLKNIKRTGSWSNELSFGSKDGCGQKPKVTVSSKKPLKIVDSNPGKDKLLDYKSLEKKRLEERFKPKEVGSSRTFAGSRPADKVKFRDPTCPAKDDHVKKPEESATVVSQKEKAEREKIKIAMARFEQVYNKLYEDNRKRPTVEKTAPLQLTVDAARKVKRELKLMDPEKKIGSICGVQVGDRFNFRSQLQMVGLHCQLHRGIDYIKGKNLAISIVDSHRYSNASGYSDTLIYFGHGGTGLYGLKTPREDQKLKQGNLALKNSMDESTPVRVIRKVKGVERQEFVYDGLYKVKSYTKVRSVHGTLVFKFELRRIPGQPSLREMFNGNCRLH